MDTERLWLRAEVSAIRAKTWLRTVIRGVGLVLVVVGALNLLGPAVTSQAIRVPVHEYVPVLTATTPIVAVACIALGASIVNFV